MQGCEISENLENNWAAKVLKSMPQNQDALQRREKCLALARTRAGVCPHAADSPISAYPANFAKFWRARSRFCRSRFWEENIHFAAFFMLYYKIGALCTAPNSKNSAKFRRKRIYFVAQAARRFR